jgi:hypothetical protein
MGVNLTQFLLQTAIPARRDYIQTNFAPRQTAHLPIRGA